MVTATTPTGPSGAARAVARAMRVRRPELVDTIVGWIQSEIPLYAEGKVVTADELRAVTGANIDYFLEGLEGTGENGVQAPRAVGRARAAKGVPLVDLLTAYRVGFAATWSAILDTARSLPTVSIEEIVDLAGTMFSLQNEYSDAVITAYRDEAQQLIRSSERERAVLVDLIVSGRVEKGSLWEAAQSLRLPLEGTFVVVVAEARELGHDPLPRAESALAVFDVRSLWHLEAERSIGVLSLPDRSGVGSLLELLRRQALARVGVSPVFVELRRAAWALRLARLAMDTLPETGVKQFADNPLSGLFAAAPHAAIEASRAVLSDVLDLPPDDRDVLLRTFQAWLQAGGSATVAGAALFCHPNTVRYRLRRIETATGRSLNDPGDVAELVTAVCAWSQLPHPPSS